MSIGIFAAVFVDKISHYRTLYLARGGFNPGEPFWGGQTDRPNKHLRITGAPQIIPTPEPC